MLQPPTSPQRSPKEKPLRRPPHHAIVPGTHFTVDWHGKTFPEFIHSFLSHAHSDHLYGIASFRTPRILHCSNITKKLISRKYPKVAPAIQDHPYFQPFEIDSITITLIPANHTPDSSMFLFQYQSGRKILFTGDFRAEPSLLNNISRFSPIDTVYMDCTYALTSLNIPPRREAIDFTIEQTKIALKRKAMVAFVTYTVGKEDLMYAVAQATSTKIYAEEPRLTTLRCLVESGWKSETFITEDPRSSLHVIGMQNAKDETALLYAEEHGFTSIVLFVLSGWNAKPFWQCPDVNGNVTRFGIPYSDHCSREELREFVKTVSPIKITPITHFKVKEIEKINLLYVKYLRRKMSPKYLDYYAVETEKAIV